MSERPKVCHSWLSVKKVNGQSTVIDPARIVGVEDIDHEHSILTFDGGARLHILHDQAWVLRHLRSGGYYQGAIEAENDRIQLEGMYHAVSAEQNRLRQEVADLEKKLKAARDARDNLNIELLKKDDDLVSAKQQLKEACGVRDDLRDTLLKKNADLMSVEQQLKDARDTVNFNFAEKFRREAAAREAAEKEAHTWIKNFDRMTKFVRQQNAKYAQLVNDTEEVVAGRTILPRLDNEG